MTPLEQRRADIQAKIDAALAEFVGQPINPWTGEAMEAAVMKVLEEELVPRVEIAVSTDPRTGHIDVTVLRMPGE